ncbi:MAG TPA: hypothetical protein VE986_04965 [Hyphomicrobiales bacterium]|nr:hypothetical protein [Hyphomicrobiales bacterium]
MADDGATTVRVSTPVSTPVRYVEKRLSSAFVVAKEDGFAVFPVIRAMMLPEAGQLEMETVSKTISGAKGDGE